MDYRKLFQVLVVGGAVVGGTTACGGKQADAAERPGTNTGTSDAGTSGTRSDAGSEPGGGVQGW